MADHEFAKKGLGKQTLSPGNQWHKTTCSYQVEELPTMRDETCHYKAMTAKMHKISRGGVSCLTYASKEQVEKVNSEDRK